MVSQQRVLSIKPLEVLLVTQSKEHFRVLPSLPFFLRAYVVGLFYFVTGEAL